MSRRTQHSLFRSAQLAPALAAMAVVASGGLATAQVNPTAREANAFEAVAVQSPAASNETRLTMQLGGAFAGGNTQSASLNAAFRFILRRGIHLFTAEAAGNVGFTNALPSPMGPYLQGQTVPASQPGLENPSVPRTATPSAQNALLRLRYDVFLSTNNALFVSPVLFTDPIGGFDYRLSGQLGYARNFVNTPTVRRFWGEAGGDFTYERLTTGTGRFAPMGRLYLGFEEKSQRYFQLTLGVEGLVNFAGLNSVPVGTVNNNPVTSAGPDIRVNATARVDSRVADWLSIGFSLTTRYLTTPTPLQLGDPTSMLPRIERERLDVTGLLTMVFQFTPSTPTPPAAAH